jgi:hypothetical protein
MSPSTLARQLGGGVEMIPSNEKGFPIKEQALTPPSTNLLPPSRIRKPSTSSNNPNTSTTSNVATAPAVNNSIHSSSISTSAHPRYYTSLFPSPLGVVKEEKAEGESEGEEGEDENPSSAQKIPTPLSPSIVKTPKKRAIPLEDVHVRNTVPGHRMDDHDAHSQSPNPSKRSRSSKQNSSATDPSTSTSLSIATGMGDVNLQSQGGIMVTTTATLSRPVISQPHSQHTLQPGQSSHVTSRAGVNPPPHPRPTTTRIDKQSRMTENDRLLREKQNNENKKEWRRKFLKAFPQFHFHLDGFDQTTKAEVTSCIEQLGGVSDETREL